MKCPLGWIAIVLLAGCATNSPEAAGAADGGVVCERYYPTGSNLPKTRCATAEERRKEQEGVDDLRNAVNRGNRPMGGAPGQ